jgi:superfamily II DNA/RNA helicase
VHLEGEQLEAASALQQMVVPDLWQQQAVAALREGKDVVVQAPTGAGKTLIFELWSKQGKNRGQAIYTVPTRALANDKLAEWRARGWDAGIATGDLAENLGAPVIVATLETQKNRLIRGDGPALLVVDEYQMIGDEDRGLNYELAIALAPSHTQLLLMSGSVSNPQDLVKWLTRLGRKAVLIKHEIRPVPQEEVFANTLSYHLPNEIQGYWPRLCAKALAENLGPILIFAPRRAATESLAAEITRYLPCPNPLSLSQVQKQLVGDHLARMLRSRIAYHHSGLSYGARAGVIEPLAKSGALRVVVATMGLAAGINFSLRSVALAGESYRRENLEQPLRADEILQMFGRAGRRGIDETGFVLVTANEIRLHDGHAAYLSRSRMVDWNALLGLMSAAAEQGKEPFAEAVRVQQRLFTGKPVWLGVEEAMKNPATPCGLKADAERARHARKRVPQMLNSRGEWERIPPFTEKPLREIQVMEHPGEAALNLLKLGAPYHEPPPPSSDCPPPAVVENAEGSPFSLQPSAFSLILKPALSVPEALEKTGQGFLIPISEAADGTKTYARAITVAEILNGEQILLVKWIRRLILWNGRQAPYNLWESKIAPLVEKKLALAKQPVLRFKQTAQKIVALVNLAEITLRVPVDAHGVALWHPLQRDVMPADCARCPLIDTCLNLPTATGVAMLWRRLGLVDGAGAPTRRGKIMSFFQQGDGLALAAGLEDESYPLDEFIYELANLDASFRFCGDENRWGGKLAQACQKLYGMHNVPGYLENGLPPRYGAGAEQVVAAIHKDPSRKAVFVTDLLGVGDIDRIIIEWRSLLRQIAHAPPLEWPRWLALQAMAKGILHETESPTLTDLPPLEYHQAKRVDHRMIFRRH